MKADQSLFVLDLNERRSESTNLVWSIVYEALQGSNKGNENSRHGFDASFHQISKLLLVYSQCCICRVFCIADSACTFPSIFQKTTWIDNVKGEVNFTTWELKGWQFTVGTETVSTWEIVDNTQFVYDSSEDNHGYLALR